MNATVDIPADILDECETDGYVQCLRLVQEKEGYRLEWVEETDHEI